MEFNIQNAKIELIQWLTTLDDSSLIKQLLELRKKDTQDWWNEIPEEEKNAIERGISDAKNGKLTPHAEVQKAYEKWL